MIVAAGVERLVPGLTGSAALPSVFLIIGVAVAALVGAGRTPRAVMRHTRVLAGVAFVTALLLAVSSGRLESGYAPLVALAAWAVAASFEARRAMIAVGAGAVVLAATALHTVPALTAIGDALFVFCLGLLPLWQARVSRPKMQRAEKRFTRLEAHLSRATPARPMPAATLRREALLSMEQSEASHDLEMLDVLLRDIRDLLGIDEVIFWRWHEDRDTLAPCAWSTKDAPRPQFFRVTEWGPLARWTAQEQMVSFDGSIEAPMLAAAAVAVQDHLHGVLTISSNIGLPLSRDAAKEWMPRFAAQVMSYLELFDVRTQHARSSRRNQALLDAMKKLQLHKTAEKLGEEVCRAALDITAGRCALLIRWLPQDGYGLVQYASRELEMEPGTIIAKDTLVGRACHEGLPLVLEDARPATMKEHAYMVSTRPRPIPSLVVMPVTHENRVIGAIVVEGAEPESITAEDSHGLGLLGAVARGSLEIVWEIEEVSRRAVTDSLTGLWNRRHFDEQIKRVLAETDRFGNSSSLILADIDHFKRVNDQYGHEAGDAVLRHVARTLAEGVRTVDICARFGGEELAILLPQTPLSGASELAERLRRAIEGRPVIHEGATISVTASFGIAGYPETVPHGDALVSAADRALYLAKADGRNRVKLMPVSSDDRANYRKQA